MSIMARRTLRETIARAKKGLSCMCFFLLAALCPSAAVHAQTGEIQTVRAGFFEFEGYHMTGEDGGMTGYGYDVLQLMARYANIDYEYTGYENSWAEMLEMLKNGEIDLVTSARMTPERLEDFAFSSRDIGSSAAMLTVRAGNDRIITGLYDTYDGMRTGMIRNNSRNSSMDAFAREKGFSYEAVYFDSTEDMLEALRREEIDTVVTSNLRAPGSDEWTLEIFDETPFYVIVRKEDTGLLETVNYALEMVDRNEGQWRLDLYSRYYTAQTVDSISLSQEEKEYFEKQEEENRVFQVLANPDRYPYSYYEDGEIKGILPDIFAGMAEQLGITYEIIVTESQQEYTDMLYSGVPDLCLDCHDDFSTAEQLGYKITDSYLTAGFSMLWRKDSGGEIRKVAGTESSAAGAEGLDSREDTEYVFYDSHAECLEAVLDGRADACLAYTYHAEKIIWEDVRNELVLGNSFAEAGFAVGVSREEEYCLVSALNKVVRYMDDGGVQDIIEAHMQILQEQPPFSITRLYYEYPTFSLLFFVIFLVLIFVVILTIVQRAHRKDLHARIVEADAANVAKTQFLSRMSHDIRTPIHGIMGMVYIAEKNMGDEERLKRCLSNIYRSTEHLMALVSDVLDVSKIEAGKMEMVCRPFHMQELLDSCVELMAGKLQSRDLQFEASLGKLAKPRVTGSALYLNRVLINILDNAVKYTPDGGKILFRVEELPSDEETARFRMTVEDTGIGMSEEFQKHLFEAFAQESQDARSTYRGTGLGMVITKNLIDQMGGTLQVESRQGAGSRFVADLSFPVDRSAPEAAEGEQGAEQTASSEAAGHLKGARALLVEDVPLNREIALYILEEAGMLVDVAENGLQAVEAFAEAAPGTYDLILMDILMPVMDGLEATCAIRGMKNRPDGERIPIIAMSANSYNEEVALSKGAGIDEYLLKPLDMERMWEILEQYVRKGKDNRLDGEEEKYDSQRSV